MQEINVIIAEDNRTVRQGIRSYLERAKNIKVVGEAENGVQALDLVHRMKPDILLLDLEMPVMGGIEVIRCLVDQQSSVKILVLSAYCDRCFVQETLRLGVWGYLTKDEIIDQVIVAVQGIAGGQKGWLSRHAALWALPNSEALS